MTVLLSALVLLATTPPAMPRPAPGPWGVVAQTPFHADALRQLGVQWVRVDLRWNEIETAPNTYDWRSTDVVLNGYLAHGLHVIAILAAEAAPKGYALDADGLPRVIGGLATWAGEAAKRFAGRGITWELSNEPEAFSLNGLWSVPESYTQAALREAKAIKDADPTASVAALSVAWMDRDYIERALEAGLLASGTIDTLSYHGYHRPLLTPESGLEDDLRWLRKTVARHSRPGTSVRIIDSERGYGLALVGQPKPWGNWRNLVYTEEEQAAYLARHYLESIAEGVEVVVWYKDMFGEDGFSLFYADEHDPHGLRPMGVVYRNLARLLPDPPAAIINDRYDVTLLNNLPQNRDPNTWLRVRSYLRHVVGHEQLVVAVWNPMEVAGGRILESRRRIGDAITETWRPVTSDDRALPEVQVAVYGLKAGRGPRVSRIDLSARATADEAHPLTFEWRGPALVAAPIPVGPLPSIVIIDVE